MITMDPAVKFEVRCDAVMRTHTHMHTHTHTHTHTHSIGHTALATLNGNFIQGLSLGKYTEDRYFLVRFLIGSVLGYR